MIEGASAGLFHRVHRHIGELRHLIAALEAQVAAEQRKSALLEAELRRMQDEDHFQAWLNEMVQQLRSSVEGHSEG
jgi:predicted RNase H-like nuclease (RuvC/YqgF family)